MRDDAVNLLTDAASVKIGATASGLATILAWDAPVAILGVPVAVLLAALTGALLGLLYGHPMKTRKQAMGSVVVSTFLAAGAAAIAPYIPLFGWLKHAPMGAVALVLAFAARWVIPLLVEQSTPILSGLLAKFGIKIEQRKDGP